MNTVFLGLIAVATLAVAISQVGLLVDVDLSDRVSLGQELFHHRLHLLAHRAAGRHARAVGHIDGRKPADIHARAGCIAASSSSGIVPKMPAWRLPMACLKACALLSA